MGRRNRVANSINRLHAEHQSVSRALVQVPMPRMRGIELEEIVKIRPDSACVPLSQPWHKSARHWIADSDDDNRDALGRLMGGQASECACGRHYCQYYHINLERNQFGRERRGRSSFPAASRYSITTLRPST